MLQFAAPLGLLALGALMVPIVIHLVRRARRVVRVGSLRPLLDERLRLRSLRWHNRLLLVLRLALLAALAFSLAGVRWQPRLAHPARWALLVPGSTLDGAAKAEWEKLKGAGFEPRHLAPGFPVVGDSNAPRATDVDVWSLLREADLTLPTGSRAIAFGPTWSSQFHGTRPTLNHLAVTWRPTESNPPALIAPPTARVALLAADDRADDARYLRAAFTAIGTTVVTSGPAEWIFQLGDVPLATVWEEQITRGATLVTDAPNTAPPISVNRWFDAGAQPVRISRRVTLAAGAPMLRDSAGDPVFTAQARGTGAHWRFALRFHPTWSDWPMESTFPAWWREQMHGVAHPPVSLAPEQAVPHFAAATEIVAPAIAGFGQVDLRRWSWLLAVALFAVERLVSWAADRKRRVSP